jgi:hypothetical protein
MCKVDHKLLRTNAPPPYFTGYFLYQFRFASKLLYIPALSVDNTVFFTYFAVVLNFAQALSAVKVGAGRLVGNHYSTSC